MLKEEDAEKRSLRVPLLDVLQTVLSPLLQHHADLLLPYELASTVCPVAY